ncbi:hypothetical protein GCM10023231_17040 [Olivibacter ginsenosidimutans]|uniref:DUF4926 domain-containing protein n=1 Tax=Olivibacter ginsenosidimutans TaxID=1176537 RepID=A0ABP9B6B5_9SPHI
MINQYDIVKSLTRLNDKVPEDCRGVVVMVLPDFPVGYLVEFMNDKTETLDVLAVTAEQIEKI